MKALGKVLLWIGAILVILVGPGILMLSAIQIAFGLKYLSWDRWLFGAFALGWPLVVTGFLLGMNIKRIDEK